MWQSLRTRLARASSLLLVILGSLLLSACAEAPRGLASLSLVDGSKLESSALDGRPVLINYWAVWCKPCVEEIPELNALNQHEQVVVLGYNFEQAEGAALQAQVDQLGIQFPLLKNDPASLFGQNTPVALPATLVLGPDGKFVQWLMGPQTEAGLLKLIAGL